MTKIKDYLRDSVIHTQDKVIGTDFSGNFTKNYTISDLSTYFSEVILDSGSTNINGNLTVQQDQADATITIISDTSNASPSGERHNPSIHFVQDGGAQNAAIGFNIIDDTGGGTIPGTGNRFWIVNAMDDDLGEGGITFGTINQDGWQNAVARFMIRGDGKGLFGHPNENYGGTFDAQFEVYDDRTENSTTDFSLVSYGYIDVAEYPPSQGAGGIVSRVKMVDGETDLGTHEIGLVPGPTSSEIITTGALAFYANSNMDTASATGFSGNIGTNGNWNIGGSYTATPASTMTVNGDTEVVGSANGVILESPNGTRYRITVDDSGNLTTTAL